MNRKLLLALVIAAAVIAFFAFGGHHELSLEAMKARQAQFAELYARQPLTVLAAYFAIYVAVAALSLPGAAVMTLAGGALFGLWIGTLVVSFASSIGATLAFLASRYLLRDTVQRRFGDKLTAVNEGVARDGAFYLFTLRLVPLFPFFAVNLLMGLTPMRTPVFYGVSQLGMLAGTLVYVNAGTQLGQIESLSGIVSPGVIGSFVLLGVFPLIAKWISGLVQARRVYKGWDKPKTFDRNLVVIGAGAAGLVSSYIAAVVKAKVTLVEGHKMGGDCLNFGCVPSKALIRTARFMKDVRTAESLGAHDAQAGVRIEDVMARIKRVIAAIEPHDSVERYTGLGVEVLQGHAVITSPWTVEIDGKPLSTRAIVIAAGARPFVPPIPGIEQVRMVTSDTLWDLQGEPGRLVVLGGGPIGCELAQAFAMLGVAVTQIEKGSRVLSREDEDAAALVGESLRTEGVELLLDTEALRCEVVGGEQRLFVRSGGEERAIAFDTLLVAVGRVARTEGYGLDRLGIELTKQKTIEADAFLQTRFPNIYVCGDVAGPYQFTHVAAHQAWFAAVNALFGRFKRFKADYRVIPRVTFTEPEVARVGLSEAEAREQKIEVEVVRYGLDDLDRAIADEAAHGYVKLLVAPGKDKILGATIVGAHAGELLAEFTLAMKHGLGLNKILGTIHPYPTWSEAAKYTAGEWKRAHVPQRLLAWVERYHAWERGHHGATAASPAGKAGIEEGA
ncbi:MAG: FAD-dependent oxidoreductase [Methylibium sp.]|uniref:FAD-dependent oxidoreductase n=1 Tax=Methylibium sp. TaxID=2067992 RepID=UPI001831555A|nr:bifunctional TVP38/TMEM64 family protein/FAD-dependent oxidoreductase [Methylibium sp.]MBA3597284.1 FAD-dependent oxidoreductase [Methylibium sp.]